MHYVLVSSNIIFSIFAYYLFHLLLHVALHLIIVIECTCTLVHNVNYTLRSYAVCESKPGGPRATF